ncbi:peptidase M4 [Bacillus cereus]|uniref:Peptidase M4 n=1 Tax=Bacillus cereus TaxID=1396 RepID=A0A2B0N267_BACCE|nr:peptidase M4 [Bacillus cereus]
MKKWIFAIIIVIVAIGLYGVHVYNTTMEKKIPKESKVVEIAKEKAKLTKVKSVDYFNGESSYTVVQGVDEKGEKIIVWVPEKKGDVLVKKQSEGISEKDALQIVAKEQKPKQFLKAKLGAEKNVPLWEVTYIDDENRYIYYYLAFQDGKFLKRYNIEK